MPAGRSYDGHDWEPQAPLMIAFNCSPAVDTRGIGLCSVRLPAPGGEVATATASRRTQGVDSDRSVFWVQSGPVLADGDVPHEVRAARMLQTATFGTSRSAIDAFPSASPSAPPATPRGMGPFYSAATEWVRGQIENVPATEHRAYYRKRVNVHNYGDIMAGGVWGPCTAKSRWRRHAIATWDRGQLLNVTDGVLTVDGMPGPGWVETGRHSKACPVRRPGPSATRSRRWAGKLASGWNARVRSLIQRWIFPRTPFLPQPVPAWP